MRASILTAAILTACFLLADQATAADRAYNQPSISPQATVTLIGHHGHSRHGHHRYGPPHHTRHYHPRPHHWHGCHPPVIVRPPVVIPYPPYPYGYHRGYGYYHGGVSVNTGRVGFSVAF